MLFKNYFKQCLGFIVFSLLLIACSKNSSSSLVNYEYILHQFFGGCLDFFDGAKNIYDIFEKFLLEFKDRIKNSSLSKVLANYVQTAP